MANAASDAALFQLGSYPQAAAAYLAFVHVLLQKHIRYCSWPVQQIQMQYFRRRQRPSRYAYARSGIAGGSQLQTFTRQAIDNTVKATVYIFKATDRLIQL